MKVSQNDATLKALHPGGQRNISGKNRGPFPDHRTNQWTMKVRQNDATLKALRQGRQPTLKALHQGRQPTWKTWKMWKIQSKETLLLADIRRGELNAPGERNAPLRHLMSIGGLPQGATLIKKEARTLIGSRWTLAYMLPSRGWWQSRRMEILNGGR